MKRVEKVEGAPQAVGPYSVYTEAGGLMFLSGVVGIDPNSGKLVEGLENQAKQILRNAETILKSNNIEFKDVCKTTIFLQNMEDFQKVNEIYGAAFNEYKPARSTVAVSGLPLGALVEIEFTALKK